MRAGIIVDALGVSQLAMTLIGELNQLHKLNEPIDIVVFYHRYDKLLKSPLFAMLQEQEMWGFNVPVMATSLATAKRLISSVKPTKKFFYVWDLEWTFDNHEFSNISSIYCHPDIQLIARSQEHFDIISDCWQEPVAILEDFNYERLVDILR